MHKLKILVSIIVLMSGVTSAWSQSCDAHFTFDGTLADATGNGFDGRMIGKGGVAAAASFAAGRRGQALALDGSSAMRAYVDLHPDTCPTVTIAAWIQVTAAELKGSQNIISTGQGMSPGLTASGSGLQLRGPANGLLQRDVIRPNSGWIFIAGVYDYKNRIYRLHWRNRSIEGRLREDNRAPEDAIWVGAFNDGLSGAATDMLIDDLQIVGKALNKDEIRQLQEEVIAQRMAQNSAPAAGASCSTSSDCAAGSYCAVDDTCHPESHLPKAAGVASDTSGSLPFTVGTVPGEAGGVGAIERSVDDYTPTAPPISVSEQEQPDSADLVRQSAEGNQVYNRFDPDAPVEAAPIEEATGMLVGEALRLRMGIPGPHGDVRDCTSFAEVVSGAASNIRDAVVDTVTTLACPFLATPVAGSMAAVNAGAEVAVGDPVFQGDLLMETIDKCKDVGAGLSTLPDKALSFWNDNIGSGGWATIGPRGFLIGQQVNGNLVSPGDRKFISMMPAFFQNSARLYLTELDGRARVTARVCAISMTNEYKLLRTFSVNETPGERENQEQVIVWDINDVRGDFIAVILDASGLLGRNFKYELLVE